MTNKTFLMIKPDAYKETQDILKDIQTYCNKQELQIIIKNSTTCTKKFIDNHYIVHKDKPFYTELVESFYNKQITVIEIEGDNAVDVMREYVLTVLRPTYAKNNIDNAIHASDSVENAKYELSNLYENLL